MRVCASCGTENLDGRKFCGNCGVALAASCPECGSPNPPGMNFCGDCGAQLVVRAAAPVQPPLAAREAVAGERRLVSVLFADLVGFTPLSASRDAEEVRDLLSRYFEEARTVIERYGGTVEKFIGDAVMAVWGAPVAKEDDAERSVRAALDLVATVTALGHEVGAPELRARAGVLTGEAAVMPASTVEGLVAGDLVNTASRIQSAAEPGTVLVGESTKRASEAAIAYEDAGSHELKGKAEPMQLWRALRVVAGAKGSMRSSGLEAPFVGRDRELRLVKELFHGSADETEGAARLGDRHRRHREVSSLVGVREVHRRARHGVVLASRPLSLLRRGRRLLGARRDGADALRDRRGRGARRGAGEAAFHDRAPCARPGGAELDRAPPRPPARHRGGGGRRSGEPLFGVAHPLRAPGR